MTDAIPHAQHFAQQVAHKAMQLPTVVAYNIMHKDGKLTLFIHTDQENNEGKRLCVFTSIPNDVLVYSISDDDIPALVDRFTANIAASLTRAMQDIECLDTAPNNG